jgi:hypothetical protein
LGAKLLNRGFHRSLAGLPTVSNATHRFFRFAPESGTKAFRVAPQTKRTCASVDVSHLRMLWRHRPALGQVFAAGNLDNRHVEIVCATSARVNASVLYQFVDSANGLGLLASHRAAGNSRSGSARLGRSQKDGLPSARGGSKH